MIELICYLVTPSKQQKFLKNSCTYCNDMLIKCTMCFYQSSGFKYMYTPLAISKRIKKRALSTRIRLEEEEEREEDEKEEEEEEEESLMKKSYKNLRSNVIVVLLFRSSTSFSNPLQTA